MGDPSFQVERVRHGERRSFVCLSFLGTQTDASNACLAPGHATSEAGGRPAAPMNGRLFFFLLYALAAATVHTYLRTSDGRLVGCLLLLPM